MASHVIVLHDAVHPQHPPGAWRLHFQFCRYNYDNGDPSQTGFRYMWERPNGTLQAARGQARIPSKADTDMLWKLAEQAGWDTLVGD
jgi:hypothetical protein